MISKYILEVIFKTLLYSEVDYNLIMALCIKFVIRYSKESWTWFKYERTAYLKMDL